MKTFIIFSFGSLASHDFVNRTNLAFLTARISKNLQLVSATRTENSIQGNMLAVLTCEETLLERESFSYTKLCNLCERYYRETRLKYLNKFLAHSYSSEVDPSRHVPASINTLTGTFTSHSYLGGWIFAYCKRLKGNAESSSST